MANPAAPFPFVAEGEGLRFVPHSPGFQRRNRLVNALLGSWPIVAGTGSWLEAHLVARLALAARLPNLRGCGVSAAEVRELVAEVAQELGRLPLVMLSDSIAPDQGQGLMRQLRRQYPKLQILLLVQREQRLTAEALQQCPAQAVVAVESFGGGVMIRALQALRRGATFRDPRLLERLQDQAALQLSPREQQVLEGLARGLTNPALAAELGIATSTARDAAGRLCRKLQVSNRTAAVGRAVALGLLQP